MPNTMPHATASIDVWHAWLCHGAQADGTGGEPCPDGCDAAPIPERLADYNRPILPPTPAACQAADAWAHGDE